MAQLNIPALGGFTFPGTGTAGFLTQPSAIPFYQGPSIISHIPTYQRDYNQRDATILRIEEGRDNLSRIMLDVARTRGAYVVSDVQNRWQLDYVPPVRIYLKTMANQGGTAGSAYTSGEFVLANVKDAKRIQTGDLVAIMCCAVPVSRDANSVLLDYVASPAGGAVYVRKDLPATPMPEIGKITEVNYTTGRITLDRNVAGDDRTTARSGLAFTVAADGTTDPGANTVRAGDAFIVKMTRPMAEGSDDAKIYSRSATFDYNTCQYILKKWGVTDIQENIYKRFSQGNQMMKNKVETVIDFWDELEWYSWFGYREEGQDANFRWLGKAGGFFESVPQDHFIAMQAPDYTSKGLKMGDFDRLNFNKLMTNKFYYGTQQKILLCGEMYHTAFASMINMLTGDLPMVVDGWGVKGSWFQCSNGGMVFVVSSDKLTLNGLSHVGALIDPETFLYGHLQGMDINVVDNLPSTNIHEKSGEIYGVFTFKRTNPDANWVFIMQPNVET